jgi:colanic acid biosynthesis glycosyl transferase WcaI
MKCLIVSAVFPPEPVVTAQTSFQIAEELVHQGHQVTVLAPFPSRPDGELFKGYSRSLYRKENMGFPVIRCFSFLSRKSTMGSRLAENIGFAITSSVRVLFASRPDIIYMNSWVIFGSGLVSVVAWLRGIPVAMSVQDVYPESLSQQKRIAPQSLLFRILRALDTRIVHSAKALIVISDRFRETYTVDRGVPGDRVHVLQNWGETSAVELDPRGAYALRQKYGILDHTTLAVYGGNIGAAAGVETAINAFEYLWNDENICMLIAGAGSRLQVCQKLVETKGLQDRVFFYTPWPKKDTAIVLGAADVLLLPTQGEQSLVSVPSKLISYLLSGRPVLAMVLGNSDTATLITGAKAGWVIPPDDPAGAAAALKYIAASPREGLRAAGTRGLDYALRHLTREANLPKMIQLLMNLAEAGPSSAVPGQPIEYRGQEMFAKRFLDLFLCCIALPVALPLVAICALIVRLSSPGPILFRQKRIGMNCRPFEMLKFRSMYVNAPDIRNSDGSTFNAVHDARLTPAGRFLRKTSLDEIPQLINVLRGEMSFVGPRPDLPDAIRHYRASDHLRLSVPPGITGLPQVRGRNTLPWELRRDMDVEYVETRSLWLDIRIILMTFPAVLLGRGIYIEGSKRQEETV